MNEWAAKRFWTSVEVLRAENGFEIRLDGRQVKTPLKSPLILPTRAVADLVAGEWEAQSELIDPNTMPATRMANSAIEKVKPQKTDVIAHLATYGETDLLCYRAESPEGLAKRQAEEWDPWLDWARRTLGAELQTTTGILPVVQPSAALEALRVPMKAMDVFAIAAFHDLVSLPGSIVLAHAAANSAGDIDTLWAAARLDELWQIERWGVDEEAERVNMLKFQAFKEALRFYDAVHA